MDLYRVLDTAKSYKGLVVDKKKADSMATLILENNHKEIRPFLSPVSGETNVPSIRSDQYNFF